jgi:hypothetical protein
MLGVPSLHLLRLFRSQRWHLLGFDAVPKVLRKLNPFCRTKFKQFAQQ